MTHYSVAEVWARSYHSLMLMAVAWSAAIMTAMAKVVMRYICVLWCGVVWCVGWTGASVSLECLVRLVKLIRFTGTTVKSIPSISHQLN